MKMIRYTRKDLQVLNKAKLMFMNGELSRESYKIFKEHMKSKLEDYRR